MRSSSLLRGVVAVLFVLLGASPVGASDGTIEINQATALSGGVVPGDAPGFPVTIATSGSYRLTGNLVVPNANTTAIEVMTPGVTLDLGGFSIQGPTTCSGVPVTSCAPTGSGRGVSGPPPAHDVIVRNGRITGMGSDAIRLDFSAQVEGVHVYLNGGSGILVANESIVQGSQVTSNNDYGIFGGSDVMVRDNTVTGNRIDGIKLTSGTVSGNSSSRNGGYGGDFGSLVSFSGNTFASNSAGGVYGGHATSGNVCSDSSCSSRGQRRYYLSPGTYDGAHALSACVSGFHMASLWEILDPTVLSYDAALGPRAVGSDAGFGPGAGVANRGWVRTGGASLDDPYDCNRWTSTTVQGHAPWLNSGLGPSSTSVLAWNDFVLACSTTVRVWCVEDQ